MFSANPSISPTGLKPSDVANGVGLWGTGSDWGGTRSDWGGTGSDWGGNGVGLAGNGVRLVGNGVGLAWNRLGLGGMGSSWGNGVKLRGTE